MKCDTGRAIPTLTPTPRCTFIGSTSRTALLWSGLTPVGLGRREPRR